MNNVITKNEPLFSNSTLALLLRVILAIIFIAHGSQKVFGAFGGYGLQGTTQWMTTQLGIPLFLAYASCFIELFSGIGLLFGLGSRVWGLLLAGQMLVAMSTAHNGFFAPGGVEFPLSLFFLSLAVTITGSGSYSLDKFLAK